MPHRGRAMDWDKTKYWGWVKPPAGFKPFVDQSSWILGQRRRPFVLFNAVARLSMPRFVQQTLAIKSRRRRKTEQKVFDPTSSGRTTPTFLRQIVSANYRSPFGKVWLSSVCWSPSAKPGNEVECKICRGWVKTHLQFEAVCRPKFMSFRDDVDDSLQCATHLPACVYRVSFRKHRPLNMPLSCEIAKKLIFGLPICRGKGYPDFEHALSNYTYFWPCAWPDMVEFRSASSEIRGLEKKKLKEEEESVVKLKSVDMYVGRPNKRLSNVVSYG